MNDLIKSVLVLTFCAFAAGTSAVAWSAEMAPDEMLRQTTEEILTLVKQDKDLQAGDKQKAYAVVETHIVPRFDFVRMTRLALGKNWKEIKNLSSEPVRLLYKCLLLLIFRDYKVKSLR